MKKSVLFIISSGFCALGNMGWAAPSNDKPPVFEVNERRFQLVCYYQNPTGSPFGGNCRASLSFVKTLTADGGEYIDNNQDGISTGPQSFSVTCDANPYNPMPTPLEPIYNNSGLRFTNLLGTKIQGISGPTPTVYLNRGSLHDGNHVAESFLELTYTNQRTSSRGQCSIWSEEL